MERKYSIANSRNSTVHIIINVIDSFANLRHNNKYSRNGYCNMLKAKVYSTIGDMQTSRIVFHSNARQNLATLLSLISSTPDT